MQLIDKLLKEAIVQVLLIWLCGCVGYEDINLPEGSTWKVGIFQNYDISPLDSTPRENIFVFDEKCNVTIVFHEIYQELEVAICRQVDQMKANFRALLPTDIWASPYFRSHCVQIYPHISPVVNNYEGPILMIVLTTNHTTHIKDRIHLRQNSGLMFNATYELRLKSVSGMTSHIDPSIVAKYTPCETNGIPILVPSNESFYEYTCQCKYSTYGRNCEWGPLCPMNKRREMCSFRGTCKQRGDTRTCICDSEDYHGPDCIHFTFFTFTNCCHQKNGNCCHRMPTKSKCSCGKGFVMKNGQCFQNIPGYYPVPKILSQKSLIKSITSSHTKEILEMCCFSCQRQVNFTFYKDGHIINESPVNENSSSVNHTVWTGGDIEISKINDGILDDSTMCLWIQNYSEDDFGVYSCNVQNGSVNETKKHYLISKKKYLKLIPQMLTIFKGNSTHLTCRVHGAPFFEYAYNFTWKVSPLFNFESMTAEPYFFQGSNLLIKNIKGDLNVECSTVGENLAEDYLLQITTVKVITKDDKFCNKENVNGIEWQIATVGDAQQARCPIDYEGVCFRKCYINAKGAAAWELQDCSDCRNTKIFDIFKHVRLYEKGITSYGKYSIEVLPKLVRYFESSKTLQYGELGYVAGWLQQTISIPQFSCTFRTFNRAINLFVESKHSLNDSDMYELEELIRKSAEIWKDETCRKKYYNDTNIISLIVNPVEVIRKKFNFVSKLSSQIIDPNRCNLTLAEETEIQVDILNGFEASMLTITIFKKPSNLVPFLKKVHKEVWKYPSIGKCSSALIQTGVFAVNRSKISPENIKITMVIKSCQISDLNNGKDSPWTVGCARYLPVYGYWNASNCQMKMLTDGGCSCTCQGNHGWLGLVCYKKENFTNGALGESNLVSVLSCGMSLVILSITTIILVYRLSIKRKNCFLRLVEVVSILIVNIVFLYKSISEPLQKDNLLLLITISSFLVLSLGVSVSHHVSIMQIYSIRGSLQKEANEASCLVVSISFLSSGMLAVILWTIAKVQQTELTRSWLPKNDASILSLVVLCYIYALIFILFSTAALNYFRIVRLTSEAPKHLADSIQVEFRNKCIINLIHLVFIFSSFYQDGDTGTWIFSLTVIVQIVVLFLFYSSDKLWKRSSSLSNGSCCFMRRRGGASSSLCSWWNQICTPYSGVAKHDGIDEMNTVSSKENSVKLDDVTKSSSNKSSTKRNYSHQRNGSFCDSSAEEILVHGSLPNVEDNGYGYHSGHSMISGSRHMGQLKSKPMHVREITYINMNKNKQYENYLAEDCNSLDKNSISRNDVETTGINRYGCVEKSHSKMSPDVCRNPLFTYFSVKNNGVISKFSSKFSLPSIKSKYLSKVEDLYLPFALSENFSLRQSPHQNLASTVQVSPKSLSLKSSRWKHRRQHSL